ncbi:MULTISPECIES: hypothetical protein [unclassified Rossellomorea]|nr:hypothetical protein [uncultured Rossellomorea sp.]
MTASSETFSYEDSYFFIGNTGILIIGMVVLILVIVFISLFLMKRK